MWYGKYLEAFYKQEHKDSYRKINIEQTNERMVKTNSLKLAELQLIFWLAAQRHVHCTGLSEWPNPDDKHFSHSTQAARLPRHIPTLFTILYLAILCWEWHFVRNVHHTVSKGGE